MNIVGRTPTVRASNAIGLAVAVIAGLLIAIPTPAAAHGGEVPLAGTYKDPNPDSPDPYNSTSHYKDSTNCNRWRGWCSGGEFYFAEREGATYTWYLPDMRGVYKVRWDEPKYHHSLGKIKLEVFEKRHHSNDWRRVRWTSYWQDNESANWRRFTVPVEIDGKVKVVATHLDGPRIAVHDIELEHVDLLPESIPLAQLMCIRNEVRNAASRDALFSSAKQQYIESGSAGWDEVLLHLYEEYLAVQNYDGLIDDWERNARLRLCNEFSGDWNVWSGREGYFRYGDDVAELSHNGDCWKPYSAEPQCYPAPPRRQ